MPRIPHLRRHSVLMAVAAAGAVGGAVAAWAEAVDNVTFVPVAPGRVADVTIVAFDGWPYAEQEEPRRGTVHIGCRAVDEGYGPTRIATHELGHILGLDDKKPGPCSSLMSGSTAGISCRSLQPDEAERSAVERMFGTSPPVAEAA